MAVLEETRTRRFTAEEVLRMVESGVLSEDEPYELLDGRLIVMSPQGPEHQTVAERLRRLLEAAYGGQAHTRTHSTIHGGADALPEPDVAVLRGPVDDYLHRLPEGSDLLLVVEVSRTTQAADRAKAAVYARAGVPVYWLVDLATRRVEVRTEPLLEGRYARLETHSEAHHLPVPGTDTTLPVRDLLP